MTERFGHSEIVMSQRGNLQLKAPETVDPGAAPEAEPAAKAGLGALLKANRKRVLMGVAALAAAGLGWWGFGYVTTGRFLVSTDDAYVRADATTLAAKVPGYVAQVVVDDNAFVHAGDVIARIDDGDYKLAVDSARDKVATQEATVARIGRQVEAQQAMVTQAQAQLTSVQAQARRAQLELERQQKLAGNAFASQQTLETAQANRDQADASVAGGSAAVAAALANVDVLKAQQLEAARMLNELRTAQAKAERDLSFTEIRAPIDGVIGNRAAKVGDFLQIGQRFASLVPLGDVYIDANFKETQLSRLRPGQPVDVSVDALPEHDIEGTVASMSPASGSVFSLLPPDNATGNFTKIVQRIPVRIKVPAAVANSKLLRPGMSVVVKVNTKSADNKTSVADGSAWFAANAAPAPQRSASNESSLRR
ncbi:HlyD family secretion protein [Undibacter mobilis]|uniref:HlyD family secretion protein n=1 Tax=Undibacter mobilis TaxID=2292256 RepID=A0A371BBJ6_9BRAD|nr:HlyD family secretion protein [Undibacter mobilis]RDV04948.1 HlyD family secretion protein [Undibacter mobilis]